MLVANVMAVVILVRDIPLFVFIYYIYNLYIVCFSCVTFHNLVECVCVCLRVLAPDNLTQASAIKIKAKEKLIQHSLLIYYLNI